MARSSACRRLCQSPSLTGKDKPAGPAPTKSSDTYTPATAVSRAPTLAPPAALAPIFTPAVVNSTVRYLDMDF